MAHKIRVVTKPHKNKDGSESETKKEYHILDHTRGKTVVVAVVSSKNEVKDRIEKYRQGLLMQHLSKHPNDLAFARKHRLPDKER